MSTFAMLYVGVIGLFVAAIAGMVGWDWWRERQQVRRLEALLRLPCARDPEIRA